MTIDIRPVDEAEEALWRLAHEVTAMYRGLPWVLVGGLMVRVLEAEHGVATTFTTIDVDTLFDVRAIANATEEAAARLQTAGFEPERYDKDLTYRFKRGTDIVDVLAPDHLGVRAQRITVPPAATLEALGGRQALNRRRFVMVDAGSGPFNIPVPSLVGAIVIKARVVGNVQGKKSQAKHERDLARLLALVGDPVAERAGLTKKERRYLRSRSDMARLDHRAWRDITDAEDGAITLGLLGEADPEN